MSGADLQCDVLIVGGGLVGSALANALRALPLDVVLAETGDVRRQEQPGFDARATALANGTRQILEHLGIWQNVAREAQAITRIHVSERGRFGAARIEAADEGVAALGYTVENRRLGAALWKSLEDAESLRVIAPARCLSIDRRGDGIEALLDAGAERKRVVARVIVAADGARSGLRDALGTAVRRDDYAQTAVIFNCRPKRTLDGLAIERFTAHGPLAVLPLPDERAGVVWSVASHDADALLDLDAAALGVRLDAELGGRLGAIERIGARASFPLHRIQARRLVGERTVLLGSAAVNVHPVAGQGFNLAMRDIAWLVQVFADALSTRTDGDIGATAVLDEYARMRERDQAAVAGLTHGLIRLFGLPVPGAGMLRGIGLCLFDVVPGAKRLFARQAMGRAGRAARLLCGQPLVAEPRPGGR